MISRPKVEFNRTKRDPFEKVIIRKGKGEARIQNTDDTASCSLIDSFVIQGLIWGGNFPQAIINNKVYKVGDTIQGATISNIDKNGIIFTLSGKKYILAHRRQGLPQKRMNKGGEPNEKNINHNRISSVPVLVLFKAWSK